MTHPAQRTRKSRDELIENALAAASRAAATSLLMNLYCARYMAMEPGTGNEFLEDAAQDAADLGGFTAFLQELDAQYFLEVAVDIDRSFAPFLSQALALVEDGRADADDPEWAAVIADDDADEA